MHTSLARRRAAGTRAAAAAAMLLAAAGAGATSDEDAFDLARQYTAKIVTRVELPFIGDRKGTRTGAGFVADATRRWVVTNAHVAARSPSRIKVSFWEGEAVQATKLYVDPYLDVAVLKLPDDFPEPVAASLDCRGTPPVGHSVGAFGHPWNLSFTGTRGIISGITSRFSGDAEMLQTDAPINPGNSGGPLISLSTGEVVGVNAAYRARSQNTNFAVPMADVCRILELLRIGADPSPPQLPFEFFSDVDETDRLTVARIFSPREVPGLRPGDVIEAVDGEGGAVHNRGRLMNLLRGRSGPVSLRVARDGKPLSVHAELELQPPVTAQRAVYASGVLFGPMPWPMVEGMLPERPAVVVHYVEAGSRGDGQKIQARDVLTAVNGQAVRDIEQLSGILRRAESEQREVELEFVRVGELENGLFTFLQRPLQIVDLRPIPAP